jgi:3-oxoacyl-[acyl-carrier-protein] synthase-3
MTMLREPEAAAAVRIASIGVHIPPKRVSNLSRLGDFGVDEGFLQSKIGVESRAIKGEGEKASDLCVKAFEDLALQRTIDVRDVQMLCVVTQNPDFKVPYTAAIVHQRLGLGKGCMTFDISQGCAGYTHGITIVSALMKSLQLGHALLFTCDPYSEIVDVNDRNTALLFGDAASVSHLARQGPGLALVAADFGTVPNSSLCLHCEQKLAMDGRQVFFNAAREVPESIERLLKSRGLSTRDVDVFLLHPGSRHLIEVIKKALQLESSKVPFEMAQYGNTISSSIPLMLKDRLVRGEHSRIALSGFGVGFSWGTCLVERTT